MKEDVMKSTTAFNPCHVLATLSVVALLGLSQLSIAQQIPEPVATEEEEEFFDFDEGAAPALQIADPLESINRVTFAVNDKLYRGVFKPVARGFRILPTGVRVSFSNFFANLGTPMSAASALLQADLRNAGTELTRFALNSTAGLLGFFDVATNVGIARDDEDLGQTLGRYGIGHGLYLVMPFVGGTSLRDVTGSAAMTAFNPLYDNLHNDTIIAINVTSAEIALSLDKDSYESFYDSALDPYIFFRTAWLQNRAGAVAK